MGLHEVSNPTSCTKQTQLWAKTKSHKAFSSLLLKPHTYGRDSMTSLFHCLGIISRKNFSNWHFSSQLMPFDTFSCHAPRWRAWLYFLHAILVGRVLPGSPQTTSATGTSPNSSALPHSASTSVTEVTEGPSWWPLLKTLLKSGAIISSLILWGKPRCCWPFCCQGHCWFMLSLLLTNTVGLCHRPDPTRQWQSYNQEFSTSSCMILLLSFLNYVRLPRNNYPSF